MLYGRVHIKEAFVTRMARAASTVEDAVAYIGLREEETHLHLYKCMANPKKFEGPLNAKLNRAKTADHDVAVANRPKLRAHLKKIVDEIASSLDFTVVTNFDTDHLLTVQQNDACFVYFGAMTDKLIHVACWLRIPLANKTIVHGDSPKIFFWVLHTSYAQELEALGDLTGEMDVTELRKLLDLSDGIDYDLHE